MKNLEHSCFLGRTVVFLVKMLYSGISSWQHCAQPSAVSMRIVEHTTQRYVGSSLVANR